jgi:hypothetical protein
VRSIRCKRKRPERTDDGGCEVTPVSDAEWEELVRETL